MPDPLEPSTASESLPTEPLSTEPLPTEPLPAVTPPPAGALSETNGAAPLREIAHAFRLNAEALHSLKLMQADLAKSVTRGDRSELVLQSTTALNETFRNLSSVQRELLSRLDGKPRGGGRGPVIPLLLLGLLVVLLGGVYVILRAVEDSGARDPEFDPAAIARRERDSYKEGRQEGAQQSEREIKRQQEALEEARERGRKLQAELDSRDAEVGGLERARRTAELERDEFASQVRKAQSEVMAKKLLEDEVVSMRTSRDQATQGLQGLQHELDLQQRTNAWLRQRLADYGMGFLEDEPAWDPAKGGEPPKTVLPNLKLPEKTAPAKPVLTERQRRLELLKAGRVKMGMPIDDLVGAGDSSVPPPAAPIPPPPATTNPDARRPGVVSPDRPPAPEAPQGAAYGGDEPGVLPPPILRRRGGLDRAPASVEPVRARINELLDQSGPSGRAGWEITRVDGVAQDRLGGVVLLYHDASGRLVESIEARDMRVSVDRERNTVELTLREGTRVSKNKRSTLPNRGMRIVVAEGKQAAPWKASSLTMVRTR